MKQPLRFCMVTTFYPPYHFGGDAIYVQRLCQELAQHGHQVEVIHNADAYLALGGPEPDHPSDGHGNVTVHTLRSRHPLAAALAMQQTGTPAGHGARVREILDQGFDVIHYHNVSLAGGPQVLQWGHGIKLYTTHEYWLVCPTHTLFRFNRAACTRRNCLLCQLVYRRPPQLWRHTHLLAESVRHVDLFLTPSRFSAAKHQELGLDLPTARLPLFVPPLQAEPTRYAQGPYFLFVGRLERLKGLQSLIHAFPRHGRARLLVVGTGSEEPRLRQSAADSPNIEFLGHLPVAALQALYRDALALIVPSLCWEVFGQVSIEAFAQGTPAIVRNHGALPEIMEESGAGLVYQTEDDLLAAMDRLLADHALRDELGARALEAYRRLWTPQAHLERYLSLIAAVAAR